MISQIFKKQIDNNILFNLLENICSIHDNKYVYNNDAYKKGIFFDLIKPFLESCTEYYHVSKRKYLTRTLSYNNFTAVIRQICKFNKLAYTSKIKYDKSNYDIVYYVNVPQERLLLLGLGLGMAQETLPNV